jgi:hypothetical protein
MVAGYAQRRGGFVEREAGIVDCNLEQDTAGLAKVDRTKNSSG